jgi:hypothetical protein
LNPGAWELGNPSTLAPLQDTKRVNPNAKALAAFQEEVNEYVEIRSKLERTLPPVPAEATAEQLDQRQRALAALIQKARHGAKQGDLFVRDVRPILRRLLNGVFTGRGGRELRGVVMDENPGDLVKLTINGRYPDTIPLSSVPPQILSVLPRLPDGVEYRFIGSSLILLDAHAHIIADYMTGAVPR